MSTMKGAWGTIKNFKRSEFDDHTAPGTGDNMDMDFVLKLDKLRSQVGFALKINSGYRTKAHNAAVGGVPNSAHTKGLAADIRWATGAQLYRIIAAATAMGIYRMGIDFKEKYIHLDMDHSLPTPTVWTY